MSDWGIMKTMYADKPRLLQSFLFLAQFLYRLAFAQTKKSPIQRHAASTVKRKSPNSVVGYQLLLASERTQGKYPLIVTMYTNGRDDAKRDLQK